MAIPEGFLSYAWVAVWAVVAPAVFGLGVVRALGLGAAAGRCASWAFAYLVGQFVLAHAMALWLVLGQPVPGVAVPAVAAAVGVWLCRRARSPAPAASGDDGGPWLAVVTTLLVLVWLHECLLANATPIRFSDEAQIWAAKAKVFYGTTTIDLGLGLSIVEHADYPNLAPLVQVLAFAASGRVLHFENRLPLQCFGIALLLLLAAASGRRAHPFVAAMALVACSATLVTGQGTSAYADVPLAFAALATVEALLRWRETGERVWWRLACLAMAAMLATKNEGAMLALAIAGPAGLWWFCGRGAATTRPAVGRRELAWLLVPVSTIVLHQLFNRAHGLRNDLMDPALAGGRGMLERIVDQGPSHGPQVLACFGKMAIDPSLHRLLPLLFMVAAIAALVAGGRRWLREPAAMVWCIVSTAIAGYMLVYVGTHADLAWHLATAAARTVEHVVPLAALGCCMTIAPRALAHG